MKFVSIDIETSGLNSENCCILSIGAVIEDTKKKLPIEELPKFNVIVLQREICGEPRALNMNKDIIQLMGDYIEGDNDVRKLLDLKSGYKFYEKDDVVKHFFDFLFLNGYGYQINPVISARNIGDKILPIFNANIKPIHINAAGKNFGTFDKLFLEKLPWWKKLIIARQRIIDPGILYCNWDKDETIPGLSECKKRANIDGVVSHKAIEDAFDVIELLRKFY